MSVVLGDASQMIQRIVNARSGCIWLFGAALTAPSAPGGRGVPGVDGVVGLIRSRYAGDAAERDAFDAAVAAGASNRYQAAFAHLHRTHGPDEVARVIREAVLEARVDRGSPLAARAIDGDAQACRTLENDLAGWHLSDAVSSAGRIAAGFPDTFGRYVLTTNFDPLVETAIQRAGGSAIRSALHSDGRFTNVDASGTHVVHLHGDWFRSDTLHTPAQLTQARPMLAGSLRYLLRTHTLVALGYGGWDDVLTQALAQIVREDDAHFDVVWGFYEKSEEAIAARYQRLADSLAPGELRGRVTYYAGVDLATVLPAVWKRLSASRAVPAEPPAPSRPSKQPGATPRSRQDLLQALVDRDPVVSLAASRELSKDADAIPDVVACVAGDLVPAAAIARVLASQPAAAAAAALPVVLAGRWPESTRVAEYLSPPLAPHMADGVGAAISKGNVDRTRPAVAALGRLGATSWAFKLDDLIEYHAEKYAGTVVEALVHLFVHSHARSFVDEVSPTGDRLRTALHTAAANHRHIDAIFGLGERLVMQNIRGAHADVLLTQWLGDSLLHVRRIAVDALGDARIGRATGALVRLLQAESDPYVAKTTARALASIATPAAIDALRAAGDWGFEGLLMAIDQIADKGFLADVADRVIRDRAFMRWTALRAYGRLGDSARAAAVREEMSGTLPIDRGCAALALARLIGPAAAGDVRRNWTEASDPLERILTGLAILEADRTAWADMEAPLRRDLASEIPAMFFLPLQQDIIEVLSGVGEPAAAVTAAWHTFLPRTELRHASGTASG